MWYCQKKKCCNVRAIEKNILRENVKYLDQIIMKK